MIFDVKYIQWGNVDRKDHFMSKLGEFGWREKDIHGGISYLPLPEHEYYKYWKIREKWIYNKEDVVSPFSPKCVQYDVYFASVPIITFQKNIYVWETMYQFGRWNNDFLHTLRHEKEYSMLLSSKLPKEMVLEIHKLLVNF